MREPWSPLEMEYSSWRWSSQIVNANRKRETVCAVGKFVWKSPRMNRAGSRRRVPHLVAHCCLVECSSRSTSFRQSIASDDCVERGHRASDPPRSNSSPGARERWLTQNDGDKGEDSFFIFHWPSVCPAPSLLLLLWSCICKTSPSQESSALLRSLFLVYGRCHPLQSRR